MGRYIARRLLQTIPMLFLLSILLFALVNVAPGGPLAGHGRSRHMKPEKAEMLKRQFGLDKPLPVQYVVWLIGNDWMMVDADGDGIVESKGERRGILRGDFGFSFQTREPVLEEIAARLPNTIYLMSITLIESFKLSSTLAPQIILDSGSIIELTISPTLLASFKVMLLPPETCTSAPLAFL